MSKYEYTSSHGYRLTVDPNYDKRDGGAGIQTHGPHRTSGMMYLPTDPAELHIALPFITDPTPAEVADLLARVLEAAGHELPDVQTPHRDAAEHLRCTLIHLAHWRAALTQEAAKAAEEERVNAEAERLRKLYLDPVNGGWDAVARDSLARQNGGES